MPAGNWVFVATVSGVGPTFASLDSDPVSIESTQCELRDGSGQVLGGGASGFFTGDDVLFDTRTTITINGGAFVPEGAKTIQIWCKASSNGDTVGFFSGAQLLIMEVGGFF